jgi:hypothetical protein
VTGQGAATFTEAGRRLVLWVGKGHPRRLDGACASCQLDLKAVGPDQVAGWAPAARAAVIELPDSDGAFAWASPIVQEALDHGLAVALVMEEENEGAAPHAPDPELYTRFYERAKRLQEGTHGRVSTFYRDDDRVASWAMQCAPGPGDNAGMTICGEPLPDPASMRLFRRAFHDLAAIRLTRLAGGKSGAGVWRVEPAPAENGKLSQPVVAKMHSVEKMRAERSNYELVYASVPFRVFAPLRRERSVEGFASGLAVYDMVEKAQPLSSALPVAVPSALIASLFDHTLAGLHGGTGGGAVSLADAFGPARLKALRWSAELAQAAAAAQAGGGAVPGPDELRARMVAFAHAPFRAGMVHGDLHVGNLFVGWASSDVIMIDYGGVLAEAPVAADAACLETSVALPSLTWDPAETIEQLAPVDEAWLRAAYTYPLTTDVPSGANEAWRADSVRAIRANALQREPDPRVYAFAVAAYLLRYASFEGHAPLESRALAYELAARLVCHAEHHARDVPAPLEARV